MNKQTLLAIGIRIIGIFTGLDFILGVVRVIVMAIYSSGNNASSFLSLAAYPQIQFQDLTRLFVQGVFMFVFLKYPEAISHLLVRDKNKSSISVLQRVQIIEIILIVLGLNTLISGIRFAVASVSLLVEAQSIYFPFIFITVFIYLTISVVLLTKCAGLAEWLDRKMINRFLK